MAGSIPSIERRRFLELGAAASLSAILPELSDASDAGLVRPHAAIYDERFEAARRFATSVRRVGVPVQAIRGDVTQLWYSRLYPLWKRAPVPIAGLTAYAAMFCLERLAWDQRLRMIRFAEASSRWLWASSLAAPARGAAADAFAASAAGPLHLWLIAEPAQLAAFTARSSGA